MPDQMDGKEHQKHREHEPKIDNPRIEAKIQNVKARKYVHTGARFTPLLKNTVSTTEN